MHIGVINKTPAQWLAALRPKLAPAKIAEILRAFAPTPPAAVYQFRAPQQFFRARDSARPYPIWGPNWWADATAMAAAQGRAGQFEGWLKGGEIANIVRNYYRENNAVSYDWSDMIDLWQIDLEGGLQLEGIYGLTAAQPEWAGARGGPPSKTAFKGGYPQAYLYVPDPFFTKPVSY